MTRNPRIAMFTGLIVVLMVRVSIAEEPRPDELRAKAEQLQREAQMLRQQAEERERQRQPAPQPPGPAMEELHRRIGQMKEKLEVLRREGRNEDANRMEQEIQNFKRQIEEMERQRQPSPQPPGPSPDPGNRGRILNDAADHLCEAAKRLHDAGMHDLAEQLMRRAEEVRREAQGPQPGLNNQGPPEGLHREMDQLRRDLDQLRNQLHEVIERLRQQR